MRYLKQNEIKDDYYRYVVVIRKPDLSGLPDDTSPTFFTFETEGKAHAIAQKYSDAGFYVDTYYAIGRNERTGTEL